MCRSHEPDLGIGFRPSICWNATGSVPHRGEGVRARIVADSPRVKLAAAGAQAIRRQIHEAARKLRNAKSLEHPLVVVLTDPHQALWGLLWPRELIAAVHSDMTIHMPIVPGGGQGVRQRLRAAAMGSYATTIRTSAPWSWSTNSTPASIGPTHMSDAYVRRICHPLTGSPGAIAGVLRGRG
jgi:hypothetical protein